MLAPEAQLSQDAGHEGHPHGEGGGRGLVLEARDRDRVRVRDEFRDRVWVYDRAWVSIS